MLIKIKEIRKQKKMSIRQLSIKSEVARGYISELESGKQTNPSAKVLCKLCKALNCTLDELIDCEGE